MYSVKKLANYVFDVTFWQSLFRQYCANLWNSVHKVRQKGTLKRDNANRLGKIPYKN